MDALRFAATKIQPPRLRSARIARPRLQAQLGAALRERRLVLLLAPAGFGKTCALATECERVAAQGGALAWVSLDADDDAQRLFACLVGALEPHDLPWRTAPEALLSQLGEGEAGARRAVTELVNALAAADVAHGVIVLDDLHRVQAPPVFALLSGLIERLPPNWTLALSTRAEPALPLARWRVADELAEFGLPELRFDADEAAALVAASLDPGDATAGARGADMFQRTQGWPAGLRLCLAALRSRPGGAVGLGSAGGARIGHHLFDYLAGEVLDDMPAELHDFLLRCSVLPVLTATRCAAVSGDPRAADRLDEIERRGLFVTALDSDERSLVLHDLFREALDERLRRRHPELLPSLLQRAAAGEPDPLRCVGFLLRAAEWAQAEAVLVGAADDLIMQGARREVQRVVDQFPGAWRDASVRLLRVRGVCHSQGWEWADAEQALRAAIAAGHASGSIDEVRLAQAVMAAVLHGLGRHVPCQDLIDELVPLPMTPQARLILQTSECSMLFRRGELERLPVVYAEQLAELERSGSLFTWWVCAPSNAWMSVRGMRALMQRYARSALQRIGERALTLRAELRMMQAWMQLWSGEIEAALAEADAAASDGRWLASSATLEGNLLAFHAIADAMRGRRDAVAHMLDTWFARADGLDAGAARAWRHDTASFAVRMHDVLGSEPSAAERWATHFAFEPPTEAALEAEAARTSSYVVRLAAAQGRWADAVALFERVLPLAPRLDSLGQTNELHLRAAHALLRVGRLDDAARVLAPALERVRSEHERGHALMCGPAVLTALASERWGDRLAPARSPRAGAATRTGCDRCAGDAPAR
ncbi:MAG: transcriptional regulator [Burkholderiales bacterium]